MQAAASRRQTAGAPRVKIKHYLTTALGERRSPPRPSGNMPCLALLKSMRFTYLLWDGWSPRQL